MKNADCIAWAQGMVQWPVIVIMNMNFQNPHEVRNLSNWTTVSFYRRPAPWLASYLTITLDSEVKVTVICLTYAVCCVT